MKILHVLQSSHFSGAENVACQIIKMFECNSDMEMAYASKEGNIRDALKERNIEFYPMKKLCISELNKVINLYKPDVIHAHDVTASVTSFLVARKIPIISHMHVNHENMSNLNIKTVVYLLSTIRYKHIFWVSKSSFDNYVFKKFLSDKSSVLYNVIDGQAVIEKMLCDRKNYSYDISYVGRITYQKNPDLLIDVLKKVKIRLPNFKAAIVGDGDLFDYMKGLVIDNNLEKNVDLLGFKKNPLKILHDSRAMIMTSRFEGTPMIALEAMALGVPIIGTPTDGLVDLVDNGQTGYLSSKVEVLADKIVLIISNKETRKELSTKTIRKFDYISDLNNYKLILTEAYNIKGI